MAFATFDDVRALSPDLITEDRQEQVDALLEVAASMLSTFVVVDETDEQQAANLKTVSCNMVARAMVASASSTFGVEELSATMGPFAQTAKFANPSGDMFVTKMERRLLGIHGSMGRMLYPYDASEPTYVG